MYGPEIISHFRCKIVADGVKIAHIRQHNQLFSELWGVPSVHTVNSWRLSHANTRSELIAASLLSLFDRYPLNLGQSKILVVCGNAVDVGKAFFDGAQESHPIILGYAEDNGSANPSPKSKRVTRCSVNYIMTACDRGGEISRPDLAGEWAMAPFYSQPLPHSAACLVAALK
jgi:hypothetical protein